MIYITGDTHIPIDIYKLNSRFFPEGKVLTKNDYLIICGDFGAVWSNSGEDRYWQKWLQEKPWTTLFCDGNHENFDLLNSYPIEEWNGGKIHKINDSVYHLMRGQIYTIDNHKFFVMGGASSHDKIYRKENISWWSAELPTDNEYNEAFENLEKHNYEVDYVITHCVGDRIQSIINPCFEHDKLTNFLNVVASDLKFKHWFFGHYHIDKQINKQFRAIYNDIIPLSFEKYK